MNPFMLLSIAHKSCQLQEFKDFFTWIYKDLKQIPLELAQHKITLNITIPPTHHTKYYMNPNYVDVIKHDIDKLLALGFFQLVEEAT